MSTTPDQTMTRYVVLIYQRESAGGVADIPPEIMEANERFDGQVTEQGGRVVPDSPSSPRPPPPPFVAR
jgi:hypothetical protein